MSSKEDRPSPLTGPLFAELGNYAQELAQHYAALGMHTEANLFADTAHELVNPVQPEKPSSLPVTGRRRIGRRRK